jgi:hypothetical protein
MADTQALGACDRKVVEVQVLFRPQKKPRLLPDAEAF